MDVVGQVPSESARREINVGAHFLEVVPTEGNDVFVGGQKTISLQPLNAVARFAAQKGFYLLRNYRPPEYPGERVVNGRLELALDPRRQPPLAIHARAFARTCRSMSPARGKRFARCPLTPAWYRDSTIWRHRRNSENCVRPAQRRCPAAPPSAEPPAGPTRRLGNAAITVVWSIGCFPGRVAEWQTRWLQVPVSFGTWGFKSPFAHIERFSEPQALRSRPPKGS